MNKTAALLSIFFLSACGLGPDMSKDRIPRSPTPTPWQGEKSVTEHLREGDTAYAAGDYQAAMTPYKRALEQEQGQQKLDKEQWRGLVENLAMSYTKTGDSKNARVTLAYGVSKDFEYPMFHYVLARTYGEEGDESTALFHLRKAFELRAHLGKGRQMPDPMTDNSFASFTDSATFKAAVAAMKRGK